MCKTARVIALSVALFGSILIASNSASAQEALSTTGGVVVTDSSISKLKSSLHLSSAQEFHWRSLEATLRAVAQNQKIRVADATGSASFIERVKGRMKSYVLDVSAARQVAAAARPLIATLDDNQKRDGLATLRALGLTSLF